MFDVIKSPWENNFFSFVSGVQKSIKICSPFVKYDAVKKLYEHKKCNVSFDLLTNFNIAYFHKKSSDIEAMKYILNNDDKIRNVSNLHAKIYIFDDKSTVITSSNLTNSGLNRNYEYGIYSDEHSLVSKVCSDFALLSNDCSTSEIKIDVVEEIDNILGRLPKASSDNLSNLLKDDEILSNAREAIGNTLSGWDLCVFKKLNEIRSQTFSLSDIYAYKDYFKTIYPSNNTIEASIRQKLQHLSNFGLLKFLGNGSYKKLWL